MYEIICSSRFYTTEKLGTGLGLYVARDVGTRQYGQLHYHPEMNGFELILPRSKRRMNKLQEPVLIVDDEADIRDQWK